MKQTPSIFRLNKVPILQNKVYVDHLKAKKARFASINITVDINTGLYANKDFDFELMLYDQDYDNSVPSRVFMDYYDEISDYLVDKYNLSSTTLVDIGCGKGTFLSRMATRYEFIEGLGIDPSYQGPVEILNGRVLFENKYFSKNHLCLINRPAFVICRHTLEHIPNPELFLKAIFDVFSQRQHKTIIFIEVPDLSWTVNNKAFWDFCYEHVNYFTHKSLAECVNSAGGKVLKTSSGFNDQYIWAEVEIDNDQSDQALSSQALSNNSDAYFDQIITDVDELENHISTIAKRLKEISKLQKVIIWGMATKGIMYCLNLADKGIEFFACVDINENKQDKYIPILGYQIIAPEKLSLQYNYAVICMNPNYISEIMAQCQQYELAANFYNPDITQIE